MKHRILKALFRTCIPSTHFRIYFIDNGRRSNRNADLNHSQII